MSEWMKEVDRLVSELIDAAHGTILTEDQEREDDARAALLAHIKRGVPEGWKLVPVEPTDAMLDVAVSFALCVQISGEYGWSRYMADVWRRMYSASPSAPSAPVEPSEVPMPSPDGWLAFRTLDGTKWIGIHEPTTFDNRDPLIRASRVRQYGDAREAAGYAAGVAAGWKDAERYRVALLACARKAEALKQDCGADPESAQAIRNAQYQAISTTAHIALGTIRGPEEPDSAALRGEVK